MKKISVIIPNYNNDKYIKKCLESVVMQDYSNMEIIVVDDGSTDDSLNLIQEIASKYDFVKVYVTEHLGPNGARRIGLEKASGDYVMFVDADDFLKDGALWILMEKIEKYNVDVVRFNADYYPNGRKVLPIKGLDMEEKVINHDKIIALLTSGYTLNSLWGKIYKRSLLNDISAFDYDVNLGEDLLINAEICEHLDRMLVISDSLYYYRNDNSFSITHSTDKNRIIKNVLDRIFVSSRMLEFINKNVFDDNKTATVAVYEQLEAIWEVMRRLAFVDGYTKGNFDEDFRDAVLKLNLASDNREKVKCHMKTLGFLNKLKNGNAVLAIANSDIDKVWKNFCQYRFLRRIIKRGK